MTSHEAALVIVEMIAILSRNGYEDKRYDEACALACAALLKEDE